MEKKKIKDNSLFAYYGFTKKDTKKYPVISRILKQLTPDRIKKEVEAVQKIKLPSEIQKWVKEYEKVGERDPFIWKWVFVASKFITFATILKRHQNQVWKIKTLIFMFDTLLDDVADKYQNYHLLGLLEKIPFEDNYIELNSLSEEEKKYFIFVNKLWSYIEKAMKKYPKYKKFEMLFYYDITQLINMMKYSYLINKDPHLINKTEYWAYFPHNMCAMICGTIDLMNSPESDIKELGKFREVFWRAQKMARIGNWVSTWERELREKDLTSGVFAYVLDVSIFSLEQLKLLPEGKIIHRIKKAKIEKKLLEEWENNYQEIKEIKEKIQNKNNNIDKLLKGLQKFIIMHLTSRRYK